MSQRPLADEAARRRIREDLGSTLVVEAAAGTGKTSELVRRIVAVLESGRATLESIVAVTFTEKAAGEMKLRIRSEIERARESGGAPHLDRALAQLEEAHIGTLHAFCAQLLRERPVEARVDPAFEVMTEDQAERLFGEAFERWFRQVLADPPEGVRRVLRRRPGRRHAPGPRDLLRDAAWSLAEHRDFEASWRRDPVDRAAAIDGVVGSLAALGALAPLASWQDGYFTQSLHEVARWVEELRRREAVRGRDHDGLEAELAAMGQWKVWKRGLGRSRWFGDGIATADVLARRDAARLELDEASDALGADVAACLREELRPVVASYEALKARAGVLDFLDLLLCARDLLRDDDGVRVQMQERFEYLFVDEFQDTDPLQAEILLLLAADDPAETNWMRARPAAGKLFLVGDPKQSIYRFRRADVATYEATKSRLTAAGASVVYLRTSFRSVPSIQSAVNAAFSSAMKADPGGCQADYVPLEPFRSEPADRPTLIALPAPRPYGDFGTIVKWKIEESYADAVAAFVDWLINQSGWTIEERERPGAPVPIGARHVCLLFRRLQSFGEDITGATVRALEARRIGHVLVGGRSFHQREEVQALSNALAAVERPDDELSVYATLRGPLFALGDDALLALRHARGTLDPRVAGDGEPQDPAGEVAAALRILARLHELRNRRPIAETLGRLLESTRAHAGVAIWPRGEQALANVARLLELARSFESRGATSFRAFVELLETASSKSDATEAPVVEEGSDGVRIMTAHKAKGLEFPVVVLADPCASRSHRFPSRHVDQEAGLWLEPLAQSAPPELLEHREEALLRDEEEAIRLAYVAATRARDLLVVPVVGEGETESWLDVLSPVVYPPCETRRRPDVAPGCPRFGVDTVLDRPLKASTDGSSSVAPGLHLPRLGQHRAVWWDPGALDLAKNLDVGLRQQRLLEVDEGGGVSEESIRRHAMWQDRRAEVLARASVPAAPVRSVTEVAAGEPREIGAAKVEVLETDRRTRKDRPHGKRFGTLVHAVLAAVDLSADDDAIRAIAIALGRIFDAPPEEVEAAASAVRGALDHPLLRRASRGEHRREEPVLLRNDDGSLVEGVVDLAFREAGAWTVVDFKTDLDSASCREAHEAQVVLYAQAVTRATGEPARGVLLFI
ncbi:MAG: UvrD-helicase domain-containing protein [Deltaproteobacteria bacterium]|nr:UvrD-helicase domain-containing protein [Deltaproteobacteria bacterium]